MQNAQRLLQDVCQVDRLVSTVQISQIQLLHRLCFCKLSSHSTFIV